MERVTGSDNPLNGIKIAVAKLAFVDIDADGDLDLFVGNNDNSKCVGTDKFCLFPATNGQGGECEVCPNAQIQFSPNIPCPSSECKTPYGFIQYFKNMGSSTAPSYVQQFGDQNPFFRVEVGNENSFPDSPQAAPTFVDIDGDGDMDCFVGTNGKSSEPTKGMILFVKNIGTSKIPVFETQTTEFNPFRNMDLGPQVVPTFVDTDADGDMDAYVGNLNGYILYLRNNGNASHAVFEQMVNVIFSFSLFFIVSLIFFCCLFFPQLGEKNPFNAVDVGNDAVPTFVDIDFDGDMDCFVGSNSPAIIQLFKNTGSPSNPIYMKQVPFSDFDQFFYFIVSHYFFFIVFFYVVFFSFFSRVMLIPSTNLM